MTYQFRMGSLGIIGILAAARAASVVQTIEETGLVSGGRMSAVSKGETDPVADNVTAEGREENRRIEIEIAY